MVQLRSLASVNVVGVFLTRVASAALSYALFAAVGKTTSLQTFNQFAFLFSLINFMGPIGSLGSTPLVFKYWPTLNGEPGYSKTEFLSSLTRLVAFSALATATLATIFSSRNMGAANHYELFALVFWSVLVLSLTELFFAVFRVLHSVLIGVLLRELLWRAIFIGTLAISYFLNLKLSITAVTALLFAVYILTLTIFLVGSHRYLSVASLSNFSTPFLPSSSQVITFFLLSLLSIASVHLDTLLLSVRGPSTELGAFFSAQRVSQILYFFSQSIGVFASPQVASDYAKGDLANITKQSRIAAAGGLAFTLPAALFLIIFSDKVLALFRPEFVVFWPILAALTAGPIVYTALGYQSIIPTYCGAERVFLFGRIAMIIAFVPLKLAVILHSSLLAYSLVCSLEIAITAIFSAFVSTRYCKISVI